jgi:hypothetical protein
VLWRWAWPERLALRPGLFKPEEPATCQRNNDLRDAGLVEPEVEERAQRRVAGHRAQEFPLQPREAAVPIRQFPLSCRSAPKNGVIGEKRYC